MPKLLGTIGLLSLFAVQAHAAWSFNISKTPKEPETSPGFNNIDDRGGFISGDYLLWVPHQDDLFYAVNQVTDTDSSVAKTKNKYKQPHFGWSSGGRLSIGGYTSDSWDVGLTGMYIFADAKSSSHVPTGATGKIIPDFNTNLLSNAASKSNADNKLNFATLDLSFGREFFLTKKFAIHPLIGLRSFAMWQQFHVRYLSTFTGTPPAVTANAHFKAKNTTYGIGPRAGIDLKFYMSEGWAFLGGVSGALLWGHYRVSQRFDGRESNGTAFVPSIIKTTEKNTSLRTNLDAYFGLGYDVWFNCDSNRFYIAFLFEASEWFAMNQFNDNFSTTPATGSTANITIAGLRRHGDLGFIGGTLHLQIDF